MSKTITINISKDLEIFLSKKAKSKKITLKDIIEELLHEQIDNRICFEENYYFDKLQNKLVGDDGNPIEFTKLQEKLFHLLLERKDEIVDFETIHNEVWKNKKMSIFTMRNIVKRIRDLTFYGMIVNHSNLGYSLGRIL